MLVVSRKVGEGLVFPSLGVRFEIVSCREELARVAIDAPMDVEISTCESMLKNEAPGDVVCVSRGSDSALGEGAAGGQLSEAGCGLRRYEDETALGEQIASVKSRAERLLCRVEGWGDGNGFPGDHGTHPTFGVATAKL